MVQAVLHSICTLLVAAAPLAAGQVEEAPVPATPCDDCVPGVSNFAKVSPSLWRGAQPTAEGFKALAAMGVKTVINLRLENSDPELLAGTGLKYLHIPSIAIVPQESNLATFLKVVEDPANRPVFIHCAVGMDRTGYNAATYRMMDQDWDTHAAVEEMYAFHFHKIFFGAVEFLEDLDRDELRARVEREPRPELELI